MAMIDVNTKKMCKLSEFFLLPLIIIFSFVPYVGPCTLSAHPSTEEHHESLRPKLGYSQQANFNC
jgi:hypothetical protein